MRALVVSLALLSAFCMGLGIVIRQRATMQIPADESLSTTMFKTLVRTPRWWAGTGLAVLGFVFHALALARGSLLLVQPILVSSLLFALPIGAWLASRRVTTAEWAWAVALTAALTVFILLTHTKPGHYRPPVEAWSIATVLLLPLAAICVVAAARTAGRWRAVLLAAPVGIMFGTIAVLTKIAMHRLTVGGLLSMLSVPAPYLLIALAIGGTMLQQSAFHAGALQVSVPTTVILEPIVAVLLAVIVLGENLRVTPATATCLAVATVVMIAATVALARSEGAHEQELQASVARR
jgi:drug/metabolite transporter (DMT)-like permease